VTSLAGPDAALLARGQAARVRVAVGAALLAAFLALAHLLQLHERIPPLLEVSRGLGAKGLLVHLAAYVVAALLGLPTSPITVAAGATYGALAGFALAVPSVALASSAAFLVGRLLVRDPAALAAGSGRIARAFRAVGRGGFRLVVVLRLAPAVPFSILNFAFGATPTPLSRFALGSLVGTAPSQLGYACLGAVLAWPAGPGRTAAEVALVAAAVVVSLAALAVAAVLLKRGAEPGSRQMFTPLAGRGKRRADQ
jgi:uncharacterized membrane protein YdjX (TVP38/TMEM64 family)